MENLVEQKPRVERKTLRRKAAKRLWSYWRPVLVGVGGWWAGSADWAHFSLTNWGWAAHFKLSLGWGSGWQPYVFAAIGVVLGADGWWWFRWTEEKFREHDRTLLPKDKGEQAQETTEQHEDTGAGPMNTGARAEDTTAQPETVSALIWSGPLALMRHPMLVRGVFPFLIAEGFLVGPVSWVVAALFIVPMALSYIPHEERKLREQFGDEVYDEFVRRTPNRWWPARRKKQPLPHEDSCCYTRGHA